MQQREHESIARVILRQVGRAAMLVVLVVGTVAVSLGLATTGGDRPTTSTVDTAKPSSTPTTVDDRDGTAATSAATAEMVSDQDARILDLVRQVPYRGAAYRVQTKDVPTVVLTKRVAPYTRASLVELGAIRPGDGADLLQTSVLVAPGATLSVDGGNPIRMRSDAEGFASIVAWKGELRLTGTAQQPLRIAGWNGTTDRVDSDEADGRAFIRTVGSRTEVRNVALRTLGFWSGRTGGLSVEGGGDLAAASTGAVAEATASPFAGRDQVTISDLVTRRMHYGVYAHDIRSGTVRRTQLVDSVVQGMLLHGNTRDLVVEGTTSTGSGTDGFAVARGSHDIVLRDVVSQGNGGDGVRIDGRPMAEGPTAGGADPTRHGDVQVLGSTLSDNAGSGTAVIGAVDVSVTGSTLQGNADGITVRDRADDVRLSDNRVLDSAGFGVGVTDGPTAVDVSGNTIDAAATGVAVRAAAATVEQNTVSSATQHGISLVGRSAGTRVVDNTVSGVGPTAVGLTRLVSPSTVFVEANDVTGWQVDTDQTLAQRLENHPLLLLWLPILLLPLTAGVITLRRRRSRGARTAAARPTVAEAPASGRMPGPRHPSSLESDPDTRTRVTVMS